MYLGQIKVIPDTDKNGDAVYAPYYPNAFAEVETRLWFEDFLKRFSSKDKKIIKLLEDGYTQEEISDILKYANHSGVSKRVKFIRQEFIKFKQEEQKWKEKYL